MGKRLLTNQHYDRGVAEGEDARIKWMESISLQMAPAAFAGVQPFGSKAENHLKMIF
jgi:hypothetical protein